jgi:hypothetical protein
MDGKKGHHGDLEKWVQQRPLGSSVRYRALSELNERITKLKRAYSNPSFFLSNFCYIYRIHSLIIRWATSCFVSHIEILP